MEEVPTEDFEAPHRMEPIVLVVDDEPLVADTLSTILYRAGYSTMRAYDGAEALRMAHNCPPHILISDVAMPGMNGVELAVAMLAMQPTCKILLFSGHATSADLVFAHECGHELTLLPKPVHPSEMLRQISMALGLEQTTMKPIYRAKVVSIDSLHQSA